MRTSDGSLKMALRWCAPAAAVLALGLAVSACADDADPLGPDPIATMKFGEPGGGGGGGNESLAGNNLSFPVIWAEGVTKTLRGTAGTVLADGEWWWWWGEALVEKDPPLACPPDPDDNAFCDDGIANSTGSAPGAVAMKAYLQKDPGNEWQATSFDGSAAPVVVDVLDWGDALEAVPWYLNSQVRIEMTLYKNIDPALFTEYLMLHTSGWGITEVWGLGMAGEGYAAPQEGPATQASVFSPCGRLTMQKLALPREDTNLNDLQWSVSLHQWVEPDGYVDELIAPPFFNKAVHEAADGPGYFNAEINVKGKIIFGYTWTVRQANEGDGDYRLTFSLDQTCPTIAVNTFFQEGTTTILLPVEEEEITISAEESQGGTAILDFTNNLTYMDIRILGQKGGGGKANPGKGSK